MSCVAPAYSFAAILGLLVAAAGVHAPAVVLFSFLPMLFVATSYYWMNRADPDCGTTFAWATKALGPIPGWLAGWAILTAGVIVTGLLANTAAYYTFDLVGWEAARDSKWAVIGLAAAVIVVATFVTLRGAEFSARTNVVLMIVQIGGLMLLALTALGRVVFGGGGPTSVTPSLEWFSPFAIDGGVSALVAGVLLAVFAYWGWDSAVAVNEETENAAHSPGQSAVMSTVLLLGLYLLATVGCLAWLGPAELGGFEDESAVSTIASQVLVSPLDKLAVLAVLVSALASTQSTMFAPSRALLSMARTGAVPGPLATIHPRYHTPSVATIAVGMLSLVFYVVSAGFSESFYASSLLVIGLLICVNYGLNALSCVIFYRRRMFESAKTVVTMGLLPVLGFAMFAYIFVRSINDFLPSGVEGATYWFGLQSPLVVAIGLLVVGLLLMLLVLATTGPGFFRRKLETDPDFHPA